MMKYEISLLQFNINLQMAHLHRLRDYEKLSNALYALTENKYGINKTHFRNEPEAAKQLVKDLQQ